MDIQVVNGSIRMLVGKIFFWFFCWFLISINCSHTTNKDNSVKQHIFQRVIQADLNDAGILDSEYQTSVDYAKIVKWRIIAPQHSYGLENILFHYFG